MGSPRLLLDGVRNEGNSEKEKKNISWPRVYIAKTSTKEINQKYLWQLVHLAVGSWTVIIVMRKPIPMITWDGAIVLRFEKNSDRIWLCLEKNQYQIREVINQSLTQSRWWDQSLKSGRGGRLEGWLIVLWLRLCIGHRRSSAYIPINSCICLCIS